MYKAEFVGLNPRHSGEIHVDRFVNLFSCSLVLVRVINFKLPNILGFAVHCQCSASDTYGLAKRRLQKSVYAKKVEHFQHGQVEVTIPPASLRIFKHAS